MAPAATSCHACGKRGASCCAAVDAGPCGSATASARSSRQGRATLAQTADLQTENPRAPAPRWHRAYRTPSGRPPPSRARIRQRWLPLPTCASHAARTAAGCCFVVDARTRGSAIASARSSLTRSSVTRAQTAAPTERRDPLPLQLRPQWTWQSWTVAIRISIRI